MMWWGDGWGWMMAGGFLLMLLFWGGLIALVVLAVQAIARSTSRRDGDVAGPAAARDKTALEILNERYARGEITRAEYEDIRRDITT